MDLKKNYERWFGKLEKKEEQKPAVLTESEKQKFANLSNMLAKKYPNAPLTLKEGYVFVGYKKLERIEVFLKRPSLTIQETVRSISQSGKKGLL